MSAAHFKVQCCAVVCSAENRSESASCWNSVNVHEGCCLGLQRFVDIIDYVNYKNVSISIFVHRRVAPLATPIAQTCSYPYLKVHCVIFRMIYRLKCNIIYITTFSEEHVHHSTLLENLSLLLTKSLLLL